MTTSANVADLQVNVVGRTNRPLSFVVIVLIFSEVKRGRRYPLVPEDHKKTKNKIRSE